MAALNSHTRKLLLLLATAGFLPIVFAATSLAGPATWHSGKIHSSLPSQGAPSPLPETDSQTIDTPTPSAPASKFDDINEYVRNVRDGFDRVAGEANARHAAKVDQLDENYLNFLNNLLHHFSSRGEADAALATLTEVTRVKQGGLLANPGIEKASDADGEGVHPVKAPVTEVPDAFREQQDAAFNKTSNAGD